MRGMTAWTLVVILAVFALSTGCEDKNKEVAAAPTQEPVQKFPEATVPPPEPQPAPTATNTPPPPPVDTTAEKPAAKSSHKSKQQPKESYATKEKKGGKTYVVKKGDTLQKISEKFYGTTKKWQKICEANKKVLKDCNDLEPGTKLVIP